MILGLDGGGTACLAAICDADGHVAGFGRGGAVNALFVGEAAAREAVRAAVASALAGLAPDVPIEAAYASIPGTSGEVIRAGLADAGILPLRLVCAGDETAALYAGLAGGAGLVILAGTGSFAIGRGLDGRIAVAGGYGPIFGDEGSGYSVGLDALRLLGGALDGLRPWSPLTARLAQATGAATPGDLRRLVYGGPLARREIAALAKEVSAMALQGDAEASAIFARAGRALARLATALARTLELKANYAVALIGGLRQAGPPLLKPFARCLGRLAPSARPVEPALTPLGGSLLAALAAIDIEPAPAVITRIKTGLLEKSGGLTEASSQQ